jgi:hypothetical protein
MILAIVMSTALTLRADSYLGTPAESKDTGDKPGFKFTLDGESYSFTTNPVGAWTAEGFTVATAFDKTHERSITISFEGKKKGTYIVSMDALSNQIHYIDLVNTYDWIAAGAIGSGKIKVTKYGSVGDKIKGKFSGVLRDKDQGEHPISGSFLVQRIASPQQGVASPINLSAERVRSLEGAIQPFDEGE